MAKEVKDFKQIMKEIDDFDITKCNICDKSGSKNKFSVDTPEWQYDVVICDDCLKEIEHKMDVMHTAAVKKDSKERE